MMIGPNDDHLSCFQRLLQSIKHRFEECHVHRETEPQHGITPAWPVRRHRPALPWTLNDVVTKEALLDKTTRFQLTGDRLASSINVLASSALKDIGR